MLLQELIRIPSVNPAHMLKHDPEISGEKRMAEFLAKWCREIGAEVTLEEIEPDRPNFIARFAPLDGRPRILLGPHSDTVGVANMTIDPFSGELRDACIWGRGASDTKGSMAAMLHALKENKDQLADSPVAIDFVAFMSEETDQAGSRHFAKTHGHEYEFAIVGEPTSLQIVHTTKGSLWATLTTKGKSAHASQPHLGDNAILKLASALQTLQVHLQEKLSTFENLTLGISTINVGTIQGGVSPNIVPNEASAQIDIRQTPELWAAGGALKLLRKTIEELQLPLEIHHTVENPPMDTPAQHRFIQKLMATNDATKLTGAPWFSDAAHLANAGVPSICIGPGSIDQAHTKDEFISLEDLRAGEEFFTQFIRKITLEKL